MNIENLIRPIVTEILAQLNKRVLIFISGGKVNAESVLNTLNDFELVNYDIVMSKAAKQIIDNKIIEKLNGNIINSMDKLNEALKNDEIVLVPVMTRNTLSKTALGISDNIVTTGIARAIMFNKDIIAVKDSYDPKNDINISKGFSNNDVYNEMLLNYEKTLEGFGVKVVDASEFKSSIRAKFNNSDILISTKENHINNNKVSIKENNRVNSSKNIKQLDSSIITLKDINRLYNNATIKIKKGTIVTPLAKDYIYSNNIKIEFY